MILLKTQQLEILNKAKELGIDPNVFEVELISEEKTFFGLFTDKNNPETRLRIKNTNYFFFFRTRNTSGNTYCNINLSFSTDKELRSNKVDFSTAKKKYQWKMVERHSSLIQSAVKGLDKSNKSSITYCE